MTPWYLITKIIIIFLYQIDLLHAYVILQETFFDYIIGKHCGVIKSIVQSIVLDLSVLMFLSFFLLGKMVLVHTLFDFQLVIQETGWLKN